ncbi:DUF1007 family protein [Paracoccus denitrificans]|jgi:polyphosphate kinase|nr:DUF1007 family protein [Paracoccus denitrificans]SDJ45717.1 polyphosphate kinase [Paracoccus denitrificans]SFR18738.1 polyphosphate kinase [Paracoccus denitrificans]
MRCLRPVLLSLLSVLALARAEAHPHVFIDTGLTFRFDGEGRLGAVSVVWAFDDFSSMLMVEDMEMDKDGDGVLTDDEIARLTAMFSDWPEDFAGDLYLTRDGKPVALSGPLDVAVRYQQGRIVVTHIRALLDRIRPEDERIEVQVYDPTYYTFYDLVGTLEIRGRDDCRVQIEKADIAAAQRKYGDELAKVFNFLSGYVQPDGLENMAISPIDLKETLLELIAREAEFARRGRQAEIWAKMNSLIDKDVIEALYAASQADVRINLVIRGICGLRPGIAGLSENIRVKSIVGRFLEHSRIVCFGNGFGLPSKRARVFISSADWMGRNLNRRVETLIECFNETVKAQITSQVMAANMADEAQSWLLQPDGRYLRYLPAGRDDLFSCHKFFMENPSLSGRGSAGARDVPALMHSTD